MIAFVKVKPFTGTWLGRKGTSTAYHLDRSQTGKRVVAHNWDGEDTVEVRAIEGSFWRGMKPGREFSREVVPASEVEAAVGRAAEILASGAKKAR
jgi:hypothetical protein